MQYYINVSTGDLGHLEERCFIFVQCQSWHLVLLIDLRQLSMLWQQVRESETTGIMKAF